jgi:hypothetical protein
MHPRERLSAATSRDLDVIKLADTVRFLGCLVQNHGDPIGAAKQFALKYPASPHTALIEREAGAALLGRAKALVPGMTRPAGGWDQNLPRPLAVAFATFLSAFTLIGRFGREGVPALQRGVFDKPMIIGTRSGENVAFVEPGAAKPLKAKVIGRKLLHRSKVALIAVFDEELFRMAAPGSVEFLRDELAQELAPGLDRLFVDENLAATDHSPAGITHGVTPIASSGDAAQDLRELIAAFTAAGGSMAGAVLLLSSTNAAGLSLATTPDGAPRFAGLTVSGGVLGGVPALASDAVGDRLILVDTSRVFLADEGEADVSVATHAAIEMDDAPTNSIATGSPVEPVAAQLVSLWQTDSVGVRVERLMRWETVAGAVAWVQNADYLTSGSPA